MLEWRGYWLWRIAITLEPRLEHQHVPQQGAIVAPGAEMFAPLVTYKSRIEVAFALES